MMHLRFVLILLLSLPAMADDAEELHRVLEATPFIAADFSQRQYDENGQLIDESTGQMALLKPNLVRWYIALPFEQLLLGDGQWLWQYDIELEQVVRRDYPEDTSQTPLLVFTESLDSLQLNYQVAKEAMGCFVLTPQNDASLFNAMTLCFENEKLAQFVLVDGFGQRTEVALSNWQHDVPDMALFSFDLPGDAELIIDDGHVR